jgi:hypothetical protein
MTAHASTALIPFPLDRVRKPVEAAGQAAMAEVLIFTGVQVERLDAGTVSPQPQKPRRAARKARERF